MPDAPVFYRELTAAEHVRLVAAAFDDPSGVERGEAVVGELDVFERAGARPHELSSGQRQKALLACVAARPFAVLLLDEPVLRLDPGSQAWLHRWLVDQRQAGTAIVVTTHQPAFIEGLADRVAQLHEGRTVADEDLAAFRARGDGVHIGAHGAADPTTGATTPADDDADAP